MSLFQKSVINKYLKTLDLAEIEKSFLKFKEFYGNQARLENIRLLKEENYQEGFLREIFAQVLGYTINPDENYNLTTEFKNLTDAKKADGAILDDGKAIGVIELKSTKTTSLESIIEQAFNYKNHQPNCRYIITSNFEKIRFYIDNATDFEEFNLFTLSEDDFKILYLILGKKSVFNEIPLKLKKESVLHEENISKQLYQDYSNFKRKIYENLVKNNHQYDKLTLFKKSQKLLDRFLFILFGEDSGLVPPNAVSKIIDQWKALTELDEPVSLYSRFIKLFHHLDVGHKYKTFEIPAYNGGLFREDKIIDDFQIDDEILLNDSLKLSSYDFQTEINVNILGHIFENSLNEIEELTAEIEGKAVDKKKTKRKKEGIYYTPKYITKYIVENTVGELCNKKKKELNLDEIDISIIQNSRTKQGKLTQKAINLLDCLESYSDYLLSLKILDPACGSGAFLNQAMEFLLEEYNFIDEMRRQLEKDSLGLFDIKKSILENNIYGVDINEESVEIAKLSLWLRTAERGRKLSDLSNNIKCGNSLIDDPEVAGDKAFKWEEEFQQVFREKEKKSWHITTATHNSRYSQRMFDNHVKLGEPVWLSEKEEQIVTETIAIIVKEDKLNICAYNICGDHMHILLVCEKEELPKIVQKIKSITARACNIAMGYTVTREHAPLSKDAPDSVSATIEGRIPLSKNIPFSETGKNEQDRGTTQAHLWTQKFGEKKITTKEQLYNTIKYIRNNRCKHELPENKGLPPVIKEMTCTPEYAFRREYKGGFDVVIGNPPYVRQELLSDYKPFFEKNYKVYEGTSDLFAYFYEKSFSILKQNGKFGFISNTFDKTKASIKLRDFLTNNTCFSSYVDFTDVQIFEGATTYPIILITNNNEEQLKNFKYIKIAKSSKFSIIDIVFENSVNVAQNSLEKESWTFNSIEKAEILNKIGKHKNIREQYGKCYRGIVTGFNDAFIIDGKTRLELEALHSSSKELIKPFYEGKDISKWNTPSLEKYIIFTRRETKIENYPAIKEYLEKYKERLTPRNLPSIKNGRKPGPYKWFEIQDSVDYYKLFEKPKITWPNLQSKNKFCLDTKTYYINAPSVILPSEDKTLLSILNSKLVWKFLKSICVVRSGGFIEVKPQYFEQIPIPSISNIHKKNLTQLAERIIELTSKSQLKSKRFLNRIESNLNVEKFSQKLTTFYLFDFNTFISELKRLKIKLSLSAQDEWEEYFDSYKSEINSLQTEIKQIENEIDQIVYELYGLTAEEIQIVEKSFE